MSTTTKKNKMYIYLFSYRQETEPDSSFVTPNFMDEKKTGPQTETDNIFILFFIFFFYSSLVREG